MTPLQAVLLTVAGAPDAARNDTLLRDLAAAYAALAVRTETLTFDVDDGTPPLLSAAITSASVVVLAVAGGVDGVRRITNAVARSAGDDLLPLLNKVGVVVLADDSGDDTAAPAAIVALSRLGCALSPAGVVDSSGRVASAASASVQLALALTAAPLAGNNDAGPEPLPRKLFSGVAAAATEALDPAAVEAEKRAAEQGRLIERRRLVDLTWREKGLPEKRAIRRPPADPDAPTGPAL